MLLLRFTSPERVRGAESDDGFRIGQVTLAGTDNLLLLGSRCWDHRRCCVPDRRPLIDRVNMVPPAHDGCSGGGGAGLDPDPRGRRRLHRVQADMAGHWFVSSRFPPRSWG